MSRRIRPLFTEDKPKEKHPLLTIRDSVFIEFSYSLFMRGDNRRLFDCIRHYGEFEFFKDLAILLHGKLQNRTLEKGYYRKILGGYYNRLRVYDDYAIFIENK